MTKKKFSEIVREMLISSINKTTGAIGDSANCKIGQELESLVYRLKWNIYSEYQNKRDEFKVNFMRGGKKSRINRHKIAALFYISFISVMEENNFFCSPSKELKYLFAHNVIFNAAIGIIEAFFIYYLDARKYSHNRAYWLWVKKNGMVIRNSKYKPYKINEFILAHKKKNLSVLLLATIFHSIECYSKAKFEELKKKN